ncbi:hypothetical protein [Paenibacillus marinisediminis]
MNDLQRIEEERQQALLDREMMNRWDTQLTKLSQEKETAKAECYRLEEWWRQEQHDVDRLKSRSLANMFFTLTGQKDSRLSKEAEEALRAKERYEQSLAALKEIEAEIGQLLVKRNAAGQWQSRLQQANDRKVQLIRDLSSEAAAELDELSTARAGLLRERKELDEAIHAGKRAIAALSRAEDKFESAGDWSTLDLLGGGMISTHMKHERFDDAQAEVQTANSCIRTFQRELKDVSTLMQATDLVDISGGLKMADYFFDGLIADWLVKGKIDDSLSAVRNGKSRVSSVVSKLETAGRDVNQRMNELDQRYNEILRQW